MTTAISHLHQQRFEQIKRDLQLLGYKEGAFLKVELLFFEVLGISRDYGSDPAQNSLLASLKEVQYNQYEKTKTLTKKPAQREQRIRQFVSALRKVLSDKQRH